MWFLYYTAFSLAVEERWDGNFSQSHGLFHRCHPEITMRICGGQINFAIWAIDPDSCCGQFFSNRRQTFGVTSQTVAVHHQHTVIDSMSCITDQRSNALSVCVQAALILEHLCGNRKTKLAGEASECGELLVYGETVAFRRRSIYPAV